MVGPDLWTELEKSPVYVLTSDQDWAPCWASHALLEEVRPRQLPLHVFRTSPCQVFDEAVDSGEITQGWHPNFLPGSSHGETVEEVIGYCREHFPGARTVRSHQFREETASWLSLAAAGIVADSQVATLYQARLAPLLHSSGLIRLPIYFEDDVFFHHQGPKLDLEPVLAGLETPGLKVLNFHATFVACNIPTRAHYEQVRGDIFGSSACADGLVYSGRGTRNVCEELLDRILEVGGTFTPFEQVVDRLWERLHAEPEAIPPPFGTRGK